MLNHKELEKEISREITAHKRDDKVLLTKLELLREIQLQLGIGNLVDQQIRKEERKTEIYNRVIKGGLAVLSVFVVSLVCKKIKSALSS
jgi:hypothetical protein